MVSRKKYSSRDPATLEDQLANERNMKYKNIAKTCTAPTRATTCDPVNTRSRSATCIADTCDQLETDQPDTAGSGTLHHGESNDGAFANPRGTNVPEQCSREPAVLIKCRNKLQIATFNTRTLKDNWRLSELVYNTKKFEIDVIGIQEHRRVHEEILKHEKSEGYHLITASAWRNAAQAATGGVGVLLTGKAERAMRTVKAISDRILMITFNGNPATTIIVAYAPTNDQSNATASDKFYDDLRGAIDASLPHNFLSIIGDFNAKVNSDHMLYPFHDKTNANGVRLVDLVTEKSLFFASTSFRKKMGKRWTFTDPKGNHHLLDYVLVNTKWRNSVKDVETYSSFASVGSDHRIVTMKVRISLRAPKPPISRKRYDWKLLRYDSGLQDRYSVEIKNRYEPLSTQDDSATAKYAALIKANDEWLNRSCHDRWHANNPEVLKQRKIVEVATRKYETRKTRASRKGMITAKNNLNDLYLKLEESELRKQLDDAEMARNANNHSKAWSIINKITHRKAAHRGKLSGETAEERRSQWYEHFKNLLGKPPPGGNADNRPIDKVLNNLNIEDDPFTLEEYRAAKKSIKEGKAAGEDGIMPEVLKRCDLDSIVLGFCNGILLKSEKPDQLSVMNIIPIPKSGDLSQTGNYRGISLTPLIAKLLNRMILNRVRPKIDPMLRQNQNGFRPGRSTVAQILGLRRIIEGVKNKHLPSILTFIDFCKAFDSVNQATMFQILAAYDFPKRILQAIITIYDNVKAKVVSPDGDTDYFQIIAGVLQGDTLAPYLFVIVLDYALRNAIDGREAELGFTLAKRQSSRKPAVCITDLDFADDLVLLSDEIEQARKLLNRVEVECSKVGLMLNVKKTKFMAYNIEEEVVITSMDGKQVQRALTTTGDQDFKYLGSWIESKTRDISVRKAMAWQALHKLKAVWKSNMTRKTKTDLFRATTESVLLYGSSSWSLTRSEEKAIDGCYTRMLRMVFNVSWKDHITNDVLYGSLPKISSTIRQRRLRLAGHSFRDGNAPVSQLVTWNPRHGWTSRGRPNRSYVDVLLDDTGIDNVAELETCMLDRNAWRNFSSRGASLDR